MHFSGDTDTDSLDSLPVTNSEIIETPHTERVSLHTLRQPSNLVPDVLLEIMGWLAFIDWLVLSNSLQYSRRKRTPSSNAVEPGYSFIQAMHVRRYWCKPGYSLIRATHVCRYWRIVALENRSLWRYISLSETTSRKYANIHLEFVFRVQRIMGLVRGIHVSYAESPFDEETSGAVPATAPNGFYLSHSDTPSLGVYYSHSVYDYSSLHPLLAHTIKRCTSLSLKGTGERLTEIFGHLETKERYAPEFEGTLLLRHVVHPSMPLTPPPNSISILPLLTEFTLEVVDSTDQYYLPFLPSLRKLTLIRKMSMPPLKLPISPWISTRPPRAIFPALVEFLIFANNLDVPSLHAFIIAHANTLTSLTIDSAIDIFNLQTLPAPLHQANGSIPLGETQSVVQVPPYADTRPFDSPDAFVINLHKLRALSIRHLTSLSSPNIYTWACQALEDLELSFPLRLPPPKSFLTESYNSLRRLIYHFPEHNFTRGSWNLELSVDPDPREVKEQGAHSNLLISLLSKLTTLEELVVDGWIFSYTWGEIDWTESLMPPSAASLQDYGVEYDLDLIEDDPWNPNRKRMCPTRAERRRERWETQDGRPFSVRDAKVSDGGMLQDDTGNLLVYAGSEYSSDGEHYADAEGGHCEEPTDCPTTERHDFSLRLNLEFAKLLCPRLTKLDLRRCLGVERSSIFIVLRERARLAEQSFLMGTVEGSRSPAPCSGSPRAVSSGATTSPVADRFGGISPSSRTDHASQWPSPSGIESCAQVMVTTYDCGLTNDEFEDLYAQFMRGEYVVRKPRRPRMHPGLLGEA